MNCTKLTWRQRKYFHSFTVYLLSPPPLCYLMLLLTQGWAYFSGFALLILFLWNPLIMQYWETQYWDISCHFIILDWQQHLSWKPLTYYPDPSSSCLWCVRLFCIDFNRVVFFSPPPSLFSLSRHHCLPMNIYSFCRGNSAGICEDKLLHPLAALFFCSVFCIFYFFSWIHPLQSFLTW